MKTSRYLGWILLLIGTLLPRQVYAGDAARPNLLVIAVDDPRDELLFSCPNLLDLDQSTEV